MLTVRIGQLTVGDFHPIRPTALSAAPIALSVWRLFYIKIMINKITLKVNLTLNRIPVEIQLEMIYFDNNLIRLFCIVVTHEEDVL